jgi:beta-glucosidase-like glycosyl hydrolase
LSCVKHFALYGAPEAGRDYNTVDMSRIRMYDYFPPTKQLSTALVRLWHLSMKLTEFPQRK